MSAVFGLPHLLVGLRAAAPVEARCFGDLAWLTAVVCAVHVAWSLSQDRRHRAAMLREREPAAWSRLPAASAVANALAGWVQAGQILCTLSPDAAWQHLTERVHAFHERRTALARFLAWVPLMLGLAGTMVGLAHLLPGLDPHAAATGLGPSVGAVGAPGRHLEGVFYGTLSGVGAALLAGFAGLGLAHSSAWAVSDAERFLREAVLPRLPERRITIDIEEAMLRLVSERAAEAVDGFRDALAPLATELGQHAQAAAAAAERASEAFDLTAAAVRRAGNLEKAADRLVRGIETIDTAAGALGGVIAGLGASSQQQAQIVDAAQSGVGLLKGAMHDMVASVGAWHAATIGAQKHQEQHGALLTHETTRLHEQIHGVSSAFAGLAESMARRSQLEDDKLRAAKDDLGRLVGVVRDGFEATTRIARELSGVREAMEGVTSALVKNVGEGLRAEVAGLIAKIDGTLTTLAGEIPRGSAEAKAAGQALLRDLQEAQRQLPLLTSGVGRLHEEVAALSRAVRDVLTHPSISVSTVGQGDGTESSALVAELRSLQATLNTLTAGLARANVSSTAPRPLPADAVRRPTPAWRGWWQRVRTWPLRPPGGPPS